MMFPDVPSMYFLGQIYHDVGVGDAAPVNNTGTGQMQLNNNITKKR